MTCYIRAQIEGKFSQLSALFSYLVLYGCLVAYLPTLYTIYVYITLVLNEVSSF